MKKFLAILLAMMLAFSLCGVASADDYTDQATATLKLTYKLVGAGSNPEETFTFTTPVCTSVTDAADGVTEDTVTTMPTVGSVKFNASEATATGVTKNITITLPDDYTSVGIYTYTFHQNDNKTAGVEYQTNDIRLVVTVVQGENGRLRVAGVHAEAGNGEKTDTITNTYSAGSLSVTKEVTGNLGDKSKDFYVMVTLYAPEGKDVKNAINYTIGSDKTNIAPTDWDEGIVRTLFTIKHGETAIFNNMPYGVTYKVEENDYTGEKWGYDAAEYTFSDANKKIDSESDTVKITNNKDGGTPDTGVYTDNMPYIMLMGIVVLAGAVMLMKRRSYNG